MKRAVVLIGLCIFAPMFQSALSPFLPNGACPDVGLLLVIAFGIALRGTLGGVALAALVGFVSDLLSGSLLGQHALLRVLTFGVARLTGLHVNLQGSFTQMALAASLTALHALLIAALAAFFSSGAVTGLVGPMELARHVAVNALVGPFVIGFAARLVVRLGDDEGRRVLRLERRSYSA